MSKVLSPLHDRELLELLAEEPELLAIADAVVATAPRVPEHRPGRRWNRGAAAGIAAATAATLLALFWPFSSSRSVLDSALAAVGSGTFTHAVIEENVGSSLIDLRTGRSTPAYGRLNIWYSPKHGVLFGSSFRGIKEGSIFFPAKVINRYGGQPLVISQFIVQYRSALRAHEFHVVGSGTFHGTPVYWLNGQPRFFGRTPTHTLVERVAISKASYKPLFAERVIDGTVVAGSGQRILTLATSNSGPSALYGTKQRLQPAGWNGYVPLTLTKARAMRPTPVIPHSIDGLTLTWVGQTPYTNGSTGIYPMPGVLLYYGPVSNPGLPNDTTPGYTSRWIEVIEFPHQNALTRFALGHFPSGGRAVIDGFNEGAGLGLPAPAVTPEHSITLKGPRFFLLIQAASRRDAIAAARATAR